MVIFSLSEYRDHRLEFLVRLNRWITESVPSTFFVQRSFSHFTMSAMRGWMCSFFIWFYVIYGLQCCSITLWLFDCRKLLFFSPEVVMSTKISKCNTLLLPLVDKNSTVLWYFFHNCCYRRHKDSTLWFVNMFIKHNLKLFTYKN